MFSTRWIALTLLFVSTAAFAKVEVYEMPAKKRGQILVCAAGDGKFEVSAHIYEAVENKIKQGYRPETDYWYNLEQQKIRNRTTVTCMRFTPPAGKTSALEAPAPQMAETVNYYPQQRSSVSQ